VDLAPKGVSEAQKAGKILKEKGFFFDLAYTSRLTRAIRTLNFILDEMSLQWIPVTKDWRLNERHYGGLQGLNKTETAEKFGEDQVKIWRRSYDTPPPVMEAQHPDHPSKDPRYADVKAADIPLSESLKDTVARFLPLWNEKIKGDIIAGKKIIIAAHGNSLRSLVMHLEKMTPEQIMEVNMPTGIPLVYKLDEKFDVISKEFLGDPEAVAAAMASVAQQGAKKK
jgi:2,3-bisphosphoglycerate-dependent phosphoglycerate mutase